MTHKPRYGLALFLAIFFHASVWSILFLNFSFFRSKPVFIPASEGREPIEAVAVDAKAVEKQVEAIKAREAQKKARELEKQKEAEKILAEAKLQREQEEKKLAEIKEKQAQALKEIAAAQKAEEQKLAQRKKQEEAEKKALVAQEKQKKIEAQKKKDLALQESKRQQQEAKKGGQAAHQIAQQGEVGEIDEIKRYTALITQIINSNWRRPVHWRGLMCSLYVKILPGGDVGLVQVPKSSGDPAFDDSAIRATYKSSPLPLPANPKLFSEVRDLNLVFNPSEQPN